MIAVNSFRKVLPRALLLMLLASATGFLVNAWHPGGFELVSRETLKYDTILQINTEEARIKHESGIAVFVDARSHTEYTQEHIKGAVNIPASPESLSMKAIQENYSIINGPVEMIIYCSNYSCGLAETLARRFVQLGYTRTIYILGEGIESWQSQSLPIKQNDDFKDSSAGSTHETN
ncbi:MAG: rhodanese-like domain-containing protein [Spirochaetota bacterium]